MCVGGGGGGGTLTFFFIYRSSPKNIGNIKHPKKYLKFFPPKNILILYFYLKKRPLNASKGHLKQVQFCRDPPKYPQNLHTPKILIFLKPPKINVTQKFNPSTENSPSLRIYQTVSVYPSPLWTVIALWLLISNGMPTNLPFS